MSTESTQFESVKIPDLGENEEESTTTVPIDIFDGQYHEVNPGQYNEVNPGAYPELEEEEQSLDEVQVEVKEREKTKIYNVQSKVDKFIIGEYGTISKESGQTLKGVRYTARDDVSIDPNLIYETLVKFFPMHNHQEA